MPGSPTDRLRLVGVGLFELLIASDAATAPVGTGLSRD
jgi:hypothetical protein